MRREADTPSDLTARRFFRRRGPVSSGTSRSPVRAGSQAAPVYALRYERRHGEWFDDTGRHWSRDHVGIVLELEGPDRRYERIVVTVLADGRARRTPFDVFWRTGRPSIVLRDVPARTSRFLAVAERPCPNDCVVRLELTFTSGARQWRSVAGVTFPAPGQQLTPGRPASPPA